MDSINDLIGDAAKQLMAQADGIQNQKLKASAQRVAQTISAKTRDELISVARSDAYGRDTRKCAAQGLWCSLHGLAVSDGSCEWVEISAC